MPELRGVAVEVDEVDDHRQAEFVAKASVDGRLLDEQEKSTLDERIGR